MGFLGGEAAAQKPRYSSSPPYAVQRRGEGARGWGKISICKFLRSDSCKWFYFRFIFLILIRPGIKIPL